MAQKNPSKSDKRQVTAFRTAARELECDESEVSFDKALGKIGKAKAAESVSRRANKAKPISD
jgi:hypothetical protein